MKMLKIIMALIGAAAAIPFSTADPIHRREMIVKRADMSDTCAVGYCTQNGGTTGGSERPTTTVSSLAELTEAAASGSKIIYVKGIISGQAQVDIMSDTTVIGAFGSLLEGIGLRIQGVSNVIIRNMRISKVKADYGDAIHIQEATNIWVDHCDLSSEMESGKNYYDGLLDISHAGDYISVTNTFFHDHYKASLVGHSDKNGEEDIGHLRVTYANNFWYNINSRAPSIRFGTSHIFNQYYLACSGAINARMGAQVLVQSTIFEDCGEYIIESSSSDEDGYVTVADVNFGGSTNKAPSGLLNADSLPYEYSLLGSENTKVEVHKTAGQTLDF